MSHLYKLTEWEDSSGWKCGDLEDLGNSSNLWYHPARMMNMTPAAYLKWVIVNYQPDNIYYSDDCSFVGWSWKDQSKERKFKNDMNALARKYNYYIC